MLDDLLYIDVMSIPIWSLITLLILFAFSKVENNLLSEKVEIDASIISKRICFSFK